MDIIKTTSSTPFKKHYPSAMKIATKICQPGINNTPPMM
jgi:hypothetical protein